MPKKTKRKKIIDRLDEVTPAIIKLRDERTCQKCSGKPQPQGCHWAHIYSRTSHKMRWDLLNSLVLCNGCHRFWHANPIDAENWFRDKFPARYDYLQELRRQSTKHIPQAVLEDWLDTLKQKLKDLQRDLKV